MDMPQIPGLERGILVAAFSGAVAYLCTQDKMPPVRALAYVIAGGMAAVYFGPAIVDWMTFKGWIAPPVPGEQMSRIGYAVVFGTGVCGIWLLNIIVAIATAVKARAGDFVGKIIDRITGDNKPQGGA